VSARSLDGAEKQDIHLGSKLILVVSVLITIPSETESGWVAVLYEDTRSMVVHGDWHYQAPLCAGGEG
jgi:hypothetical protein